MMVRPSIRSTVRVSVLRGSSGARIAERIPYDVACAAISMIADHRLAANASAGDIANLPDTTFGVIART